MPGQYRGSVVVLAPIILALFVFTARVVITDELVATTRFVAIDGGATLATWVNFANHPEASGSENVLMSSDFAHSLRATVEDGAAEGPEGAVGGLGGVARYFQGACGGMMTPLGASTIDLDGSVHSSSSLPKAYAVGRVIGYHALQAVAADVAVEAPLLSIRTKDLLVPVENSAFHLMLNAGVFDRVGYDYDDTRLIDEYNQPSLRSEVDLLQIGTVSALTLPGELLPELGIGGYDGSHTGPLRPLIDPGNSNPPDLAAAPTGPFLKDLMPGESKLLLGLANDEIGYLIPDYNYILDEGTPFFDEAAGDHYEETNSVGPSATGLILSTAEGLIAWEAPW